MSEIPQVQALAEALVTTFQDQFTFGRGAAAVGRPFTLQELQSDEQRWWLQRAGIVLQELGKKLSDET